MRYIKLLLFCVLILCFSAFSISRERGIPELDELELTAKFRDRVVDKLYLSLDKWSRSGYFKGEKAFNIHYRIYGEKQAHTKPLIIVPGLTESSLKYLEVAHDFIQKSFSPVYVIDHRNQGKSERALTENKIYVEDFSFYVKDLQNFIDNIVKEEQAPNEKLYLLAHSMGSLISLLYLKDNPEVIDSAVFTSPLIRVKTPKLGEFFISKFSSLYFNFFEKGSFSVKYRTSKLAFNPRNRITHDRDRYQFNRWLDLSQGHYIQKATLNWFQEAVAYSHAIKAETDKVKTNLLILIAEKETLVDNKSTQKMCDKKESCSLILIPQAKHELLMEKEELRNKAFQETLSFFNKNTY